MVMGILSTRNHERPPKSRVEIENYRGKSRCNINYNFDRESLKITCIPWRLILGA